MSDNIYQSPRRTILEEFDQNRHHSEKNQIGLSITYNKHESLV